MKAKNRKSMILQFTDEINRHSLVILKIIVHSMCKNNLFSFGRDSTHDYVWLIACLASVLNIQTLDGLNMRFPDEQIRKNAIEKRGWRHTRIVEESRFRCLLLLYKNYCSFRSCTKKWNEEPSCFHPDRKNENSLFKIETTLQFSV